MPFSPKCFQCMATRILWDQQYMFGVRSLFMNHGQESVVDEERPGSPLVSTML